MPLEKKQLSRRRFLLGLSGSLVIVSSFSVPMILEWKRTALKTWRSTEKPLSKNALIDKTTLNTVAIFLGSYFGLDITVEDRSELVERMEYSARANSIYLAEYKMLQHYLDDMASKNNAGLFTAASVDIKEKIIGEFLEKNINAKSSKIRALFSQAERNHRMLRASTLPHINKLYRHSGVPWRHRGYSSWPGVPGDPYDYTRPGATRIC